jgi:hypothetical protein
MARGLLLWWASALEYTFLSSLVLTVIMHEEHYWFMSGDSKGLQHNNNTKHEEMSRENNLRILSEPQEPLFGRYIGTRRSSWCATITLRVIMVLI